MSNIWHGCIKLAPPLWKKLSTFKLCAIYELFGGLADPMEDSGEMKINTMFLMTMMEREKNLVLVMVLVIYL